MVTRVYNPSTPVMRWEGRDKRIPKAWYVIYVLNKVEC